MLQQKLIDAASFCYLVLVMHVNKRAKHLCGYTLLSVLYSLSLFLSSYYRVRVPCGDSHTRHIQRDYT